MSEADQSTGHPPQTVEYTPPPLVPDAERTGAYDQTKKDTAPRGGGPFPTIEGFEIEGILGKGGMGVVYRARQMSLKRLVALKMILTGGHADAEDLARFRAEAESVARLQHPNIVQIHAVGESEGRPYFALEFVEGGSLDRTLKGQPQDPAKAAALMETLARAVHAAHQRGIVHRDLKPANVLLAADGTPKIGDFGLAKQLDTDSGQTHSGAVMGTPSYMSPEQAAGRTREVGPAADVYALGAIFYELLTGRPPFRGASVLDTLEQVKGHEPIAPGRLQPRLPRDLETICLKCLQKEPAKRYASAEALADDLRRFGNHEPIRARPPSVMYLAWQFTRRHKALVGGAVAVFLALLLGLLGTSVGMFRARTAEGQANVNLKRATTAESDLRLELAEAQMRTARLAAQRGDWRTALHAYDAALSSDRLDEVEIRALKVQALVALNDRAAAEQELDGLFARGDLGKHAGTLHLLRGDFALSRFAGRDRALADVRAALEKDLSVADREYAQGLLAEHSDDALRHFQAAVKAEPFHHRANSALLMMLFFLGRRDECHSQARLCTLLFPDDPGPRVTLAFMRALEGKPAEAKQHLKDAEKLLRIKEAELLAELIDFLNDGVQAFAGSDAFGAMQTISSPRLVLRFLPLMVKFKSTPDLSALGMGFVNLPSLANTWGKLATVVQRNQFADASPAMIQQMEEAMAHHPEGTLFFYHAHLTIQLAGVKKDRAEMTKGVRKAAESFQRSIEAPCMFPGVQRDARFWGAWAQAILARNKEKPDPAMRALALRNIGELLLNHDLKPGEVMMLAGAANDMAEYDTTRALLAHGLKKAPNDLAMQRYRVKTELAAGNSSKAVDLADALLARKSDDEATRGYRKEALEQMKKRVEKGP